MRRADRLFDIIQTLRSAPHPLTAAAIAEKLEVTVRTIYRDIRRVAGEPRADRRGPRARLCAAPRL
jgi:predicted DNA-binding transcriptional regulator YafY